MSDKTKEKRVNVATLKNDLSKYLRFVKAGAEVIVTEHQRPIARVVPIEASEEEVPLIGTKGSSDIFKRLSSMPTVEREWNSLDLLLEDRRKR